MIRGDVESEYEWVWQKEHHKCGVFAKERLSIGGGIGDKDDVRRNLEQRWVSPIKRKEYKKRFFFCQRSKLLMASGVNGKDDKSKY